MARNDELRLALERYLLHKKFCDDAWSLADRNPGKFKQGVTSAIPEMIAGKKSKTDREYSDELKIAHGAMLYEVCFLDIIGTFEKILFDRLENALGLVEKMVGQGYKRGPFTLCSASLIKGTREIHNLGHIRDLIKPHLGQQQKSDVGLDIIVDYRNWLAHGKRFKERVAFDTRLEDLVEILEAILDKIV